MEVSNIFTLEASKKSNYTRQEIAKKTIEYKESLPRFISQRQAANEIGIPRTTVQHWLKQSQEKTGLPPQVEAFAQSSAGMDFLKQIYFGANFTMTSIGSSGIRIFQSFLNLSGLDKIFGSSVGTLYNVSKQMTGSILEFGKDERARLSADMAQKNISVAQDETFHPTPCLVAIEPESNFILVEQYSEKRDADSWTKAMITGLEDLNVNIIQSTSDEGGGILKHVNESLGAHHSPDLFHVQQEITKGTAAALSAQVRKVENALAAATQSLVKISEAYREYEIFTSCLSKEQHEDFKQKIAQATTSVTALAEELNIVQMRKESVSQAKRDIGAVYHPYNLTTGEACTENDVKDELEKQFAIIDTAAKEAELSENSLKKIDKARRVTSQMVCTIAFFRLTIRQIITDLNLTKELKELLEQYLIPAVYLQKAAKKGNDSKKRKAILEIATTLFDNFNNNPAWIACDVKTRQMLMQSARKCAAVFQRSSSCVEGRNGQLSLQHHSLHSLGIEKLTALTIIHNYWIKRHDQSTAAERFFGSKPRDLFQWLLSTCELPGRPAKKRIKATADAFSQAA